jgi:ribosomal protein L40E
VDQNKRFQIFEIFSKYLIKDNIKLICRRRNSKNVEKKKKKCNYEGLRPISDESWPRATETCGNG